jgi:hypothetical protein
MDEIVRAAVGVISAVDNIVNNAADGFHGPEALARNLAKEVSNRMKSYERNSLRPPSVANLYLHWFLSLAAVLETLIRVKLHGIIIVVSLIIYYISYCVACGKLSSNVRVVYVENHFKILSLYLRLLCGLMGNIFVPWSPPLYSFRDGRVFLKRGLQRTTISTSQKSTAY